MDLEGLFTIARGIGSLATYIPKVLDFTKETLDTTKSGMEVFEATKKLVEKDAADHPEQTVDRVKAMADVTRSLAPLAFAEVFFYAIKVCATLLLFKWLLNYLTRRDAKRIAREMITPELKKQ